MFRIRALQSRTIWVQHISFRLQKILFNFGVRKSLDFFFITISSIRSRNYTPLSVIYTDVHCPEQGSASPVRGLPKRGGFIDSNWNISRESKVHFGKQIHWGFHLYATKSVWWVLPGWPLYKAVYGISLWWPAIGFCRSRPSLFTLSYNEFLKTLKALDTFGNCQRPVFLLGVYQHMHKITNLWKFERSWSSNLRENNGRKNILVAQVVCLRCLEFNWTRIQFKYFSDMRNYYYLKNTLLQREPFSHNVLFYQQRSIARYQVSLYANRYFE